MPQRTPEEKREYQRQWFAAHPNYKKEWRAKHAATCSSAQRRYHETRKCKFRDWWDTFKRSLQCSQCPETHWACLDFHHRDPTQKTDIQRIKRSLSISMMLKELAKCDVLCANCHRKLHHPE